MIPALADRFQAMVRGFPRYMGSLQHRSASFHQITDRFHLTTQAGKLLASLPGELGSGAVGFTRRAFSTLASALLVVVLTIYFLADLPRLQRSAVLLFPRAHRDRFARIADVMVDKVGSYMIGNILISLIAGVAAFAALTALGVPFAVPLAFLVAVTDLIPLIGATLGAAAMGLIGALMAIPIAAGIKVLLSERLQARDAADAGAATPG